MRKKKLELKRSVYGVGINDVRGLVKNDKRLYQLWSNMLWRCYCEKAIEKRPTYSECFVCDEWHLLSNFVRDIVRVEGYELWRKNKNYCLDKDIKIKGNKEYSKDTVMFVTKSESAIDANQRRNPDDTNWKDISEIGRIMSLSVRQRKLVNEYRNRRSGNVYRV